MIEFIIHIGTYKTGTTSIQYFLFKHREHLMNKYNILYPTTGIPENKNIWGHALFAYNFSKKMNKDFNKIIDDLIHEISQTNAKQILISTEELSNSSNLIPFLESLEKLSDLSKKIKIIFYIRRQDLFVESSYKERVKNHDSCLKVHFQNSIPTILHLIDYYSIIKHILVFPEVQILLRIYDRSLFAEGNVILDFLSILGIDMPEAKEYKIEANPSLSHISTLALRKINEEFSLPHEERVKVIRYLLNLDREEGPGPLKTFFTLEERIEFLERFRESNEKLFREWFNSENKFVLSPEEIEFYREQDKIPREEIERLVEERYQKVVENVIKKIEAKPKIYIPVKINKLVKEENIVEKVVIDQMYLDLLKDSKLVIGGVVVLKPDVKEEYKLLIEDAEGTKEVKWNIPSPGYAKMYPDNPHAQNARFKTEGLVVTKDSPIRLYLVNENYDKILIYEMQTSTEKEVQK